MCRLYVKIAALLRGAAKQVQPPTPAPTQTRAEEGDALAPRNDIDVSEYN